MRRAVAVVLTLTSVALPALAGQRAHGFRVGAVVSRSARLRIVPGRLQLAARDGAAVIVDAAPPQLAAGEVALPAGTVRVTVLY